MTFGLRPGAGGHHLAPVLRHRTTAAPRSRRSPHPQAAQLQGGSRMQARSSAAGNFAAPLSNRLANAKKIRRRIFSSADVRGMVYRRAGERVRVI